MRQKRKIIPRAALYKHALGYEPIGLPAITGRPAADQDRHGLKLLLDQMT
jgi:hypothetical protein